MSYNYLKLKGEEFVKIINKQLHPMAMDKIHWHKLNDDKIYVVTASADIWVEAWCKLNDLSLISTIYEVENDKMTGKIAGKNCYGKQKLLE